MHGNKFAGIFSFFSGAGFLDLGFEDSGFVTLFVNEYHSPFLETYQYSRKEMGMPPPMFGYSSHDISELLSKEYLVKLKNQYKTAKKSLAAVGFIGGPPCPDFSIGGKNKGSTGENGKLSATYISLICEVKPDFFLFENVKGLYRTKKHRAFFDALKKKLEKNKYVLTERLINSIEFGAPQDRERIILIGFQKKFLKSGGIEPAQLTSKFNWESHMVHSAGVLKNDFWPEQDSFKPGKDVQAPKRIIKELTVEHWFKKNQVETHPNAGHYFQPRAGLAKFKVIKEGDDSRKSYKRLHRWRFSPTAAYGNNEVHLHPYLERRISAAEALAIQSLPKEFVIPGTISLTDMFKTIGNGVPFLAAKGLAMTIHDFLKTRNVKTDRR